MLVWKGKMMSFLQEDEKLLCTNVSLGSKMHDGVYLLLLQDVVDQISRQDVALQKEKNA